MANEEITTYLKLLGFSNEAVAIYHALLKHGSMNLSDLSRISKVERTNLYRILPKLEHDGLVVVSNSDGRKIVHLAAISNIDRIISMQRRKMAMIESERANFLDQIETMTGRKHSTETKFYRGIEPMKQAIINSVRNVNKSGEVYTVAPYSVEGVVGTNFLTALDKELSMQKIKHYYICSTASEKMLNNARKHTRTLFDDKVEQFFMIFNDRVIYFYWKNIDPYAFEIIDRQIAKTNTQMLQAMIGKSN